MCLSETEPPQVAPLALQVIEAVGLEYVMRLQKTVEGVARTETKQPAQFVLRKMTKLVFFERQRFQRTSDRSPPAAARRWATSSGIWTIKFMPLVYATTLDNHICEQPRIFHP